MDFLHDGNFSNDGVIRLLLVYSAPLKLAVVVDVVCCDCDLFLMLAISLHRELFRILMRLVLIIGGCIGGLVAVLTSLPGNI